MNAPERAVTGNPSCGTRSRTVVYAINPNPEIAPQIAIRGTPAILRFVNAGAASKISFFLHGKTIPARRVGTKEIADPKAALRSMVITLV